MFVLQGESDGVDLGVAALGEVGDGAFFDLAALPIGRAQEMPCVGFAVALGRGGVDMHSDYCI